MKGSEFVRIEDFPMPKVVKNALREEYAKKFCPLCKTPMIPDVSWQGEEKVLIRPHCPNCRISPGDQDKLHKIVENTAVYLEQTARITSVLSAAGLTPYDLFTWEELLELEEETRGFRSVNLDLRVTLRKGIEHALRWKAKVLDEKYNNTIHTEVVDYRMGIQK